MDIRSLVAAAALVLGAQQAGAQPAGAAAGADEAERLDPITITAPVAPLDESLWRLRLLLDATTPCLGCDAGTLATRENVVAGLVRFMFVPTEPPAVDEAGRALSAVRCAQAGPESEFRCR